MRIAYLRYNQGTALDYATATIGPRGTDFRIGLLEAMIELGHDVTIVSWIPKSHLHALKGESKGDWDNSWMTSLKYDIYPDMQNFDLIFVETAATTSMFNFRYDGKQISYIQHFADRLYEAQGVPVLIYQHGAIVISFPFSRISRMILDPMSEEELSKLSDMNYHRIFRDFDIWDGYDYTVWHHGATNEKFVEYYGREYNRSVMKMDQMQFHNTRCGYSPRYDPKFPVRDPNTTEYDLVYVGRCERGNTLDRGRFDKMYDLYNSDLYHSLLVGKGWDKQEWTVDTVTAPGETKGHGDVSGHYARGLACIHVTGREFSGAGIEVTRSIQAIRSGCLLMYHKDICGGEVVVGDKEFLVDTADEVCDVLDFHADTLSHLQEAVEFQRSLLSPWVEILPDVLEVATWEKDGYKIV